MIDIDAIVDLVVTDAEIVTGRPPAWLQAQGVETARPTSSNKALSAHPRGPRWTPDEDRYVRDNSGYISNDDMAEHLGRSTNAIKVHITRKGYHTARHTPGYLSALAIGKILGVEGHAPPCWVDRGILEGELYPYSGRINRRVRIMAFKLWLIRPTSWVYFKVLRVRNPGLRRLVELAQARWGDEWWSTRQAADTLGCTCNAINQQIKMGRLYGFQAVGLERKREQAWAYWFVKRSDIERLKLPTRADSRLSFTPAADAFMLKARLEWGLTPAAIGRMMKRAERGVDYRIRLLCRRMGIEKPSLQGRTKHRKVKKACARCGREIESAGNHKVYCSDCMIQIRREQGREAYQKEKMLKFQRGDG